MASAVQLAARVADPSDRPLKLAQLEPILTQTHNERLSPQPIDCEKSGERTVTPVYDRLDTGSTLPRIEVKPPVPTTRPCHQALSSDWSNAAS